MARLANNSLAGLNGNLGDMIFYQINGVTYVRRKPNKRTNAQKKRMKTSPINERSQGMFKMAHQYLKGLKLVIAFGYQNFVKGASYPYHACYSNIRLNSFAFEGREFHIDPALVQLSRGTLMGPEDARAERTAEGVLFSWKDNSWISSAKPTDKAFLIIHNPIKKVAEWEELGSPRSQTQFLMKRDYWDSEGQWYAYLAFSQENPYTKKQILSDSVYLGVV